ncbi:hypothetical protein BJ684DRAFT_18126, partial [Piptocephalis cylindrospora]
DSPRLQALFFHPWGPIWDLHWYPMIPSKEMVENGCLGIIAASFGDGAIRLFSLPTLSWMKEHSKKSEEAPYQFLLTRVLLELPMMGAVSYEFDWSSQGILAAGCSDGSVLVWDIPSILRERPEAPQSTLSMDGTLEDALIMEDFVAVAKWYREKAELCIYVDGDNRVTCVDATIDIGHHSIAQHDGMVWDVGISRRSPLLLSVSTDGTAKLKNLATITKRGQEHPEYLLFDVTQDVDSDVLSFSPSGPRKKPEYLGKSSRTTRLYHPNVSVQRTSWNENGRDASGWVATGGASGWARMDYVIE